MSKYWFRAKRYGWGTGFPITWQGWVATLALIILILSAGYVDNIFSSSLTFKNGLRFTLDAFLLGAVFLLAFEDKIEGGLKWRWGNKD